MKGGLKTDVLRFQVCTSIEDFCWLAYLISSNWLAQLLAGSACREIVACRDGENARSLQILLSLQQLHMSVQQAAAVTVNVFCIKPCLRRAKTRGR